MDRVKFRRRFIKELAFFSDIANEYVKEGYSKEEIDELLITYSSSYYGSFRKYDEYASKKCYFIATYPRQVYDGGLEDIMLTKLCDEIEEEENTIREHKL